MDADHLAALLGSTVRAIEPIAGGSICHAYRLHLDGDRTAFAKTTASLVPADFFSTESQALGWLAAAPDAPPTPTVLAHDPTHLILDWVPPAGPTREAAARFGTALAALHTAGAPAFGAPWPGYIGSLPMPNAPDEAGTNSWPEFYLTYRIEPYVRMLRDSDALRDSAVFDRLAARLPELAGPPEPPARLHGDLWSGNLLWSAAGDVYLIDPAAHGGHRETDLAMLQLFGAPYLPEILDSYATAAADRGSPLAPDWPDRVPLHQLFPLLVHAVLFGGTYRDRALAVARRYAG